MAIYNVFRYNETPYYCDTHLPFVTADKRYENPCCTIAGAAKIMHRKRSNLDKLGRPKIQYIKAKMTLHKDLTRYEMARLLCAQVCLNKNCKTYGFNETPELYEELQAEISKENKCRKNGDNEDFAYSL